MMCAMSDDEQRDGGVLSGLSRTRPQRRSERRAASPAPDTPDARKTAATKATAKRATAATKKKPAARKPAARKAPGAKGKPAPAAKSAPAVKSAPKAPPTRARRRPAPLDQPRQPPGSPPPPDAATEERRHERGHAGVIGTAAQAAGELGSIGVTIGRQLVKSAIDRIPKP